MHIKNRVFLTCALLVVAASSLALSATPCYAVGKIHLIVIRSTTDKSLEKAGDIWSSRLRRMLENAPGAVVSNGFEVFGALEAAKNPGGLGKEDCETWAFLQEEKSTHPESIMKACLKVSEKAGPDDAIVVFVDCHGAIQKGTDDGFLRHAFAPIAKSGDALELIKDGILRKTILDCLTRDPITKEKKEHRLVVLLTDTCASRARDIVRPQSPTTRAFANIIAPEEAPAPETAPLSRETSYFKKFLQEAHGVVNINSCGDGQLVKAICSRKETNSGTSEFEGSLFINAFIRFARNGLYLDSELNPDDFYKLLRIELAREVLLYNKAHHDNVQNDLTQFNEEGSPIKAVPLEYASAEEFWKYYQDRRKMLTDSGELNVTERAPVPGSGGEPVAVVGGDEEPEADSGEETVNAVISGVIEPEPESDEDVSAAVGGDDE